MGKYTARVPDNAAHIIRSRHRQPHAVSGAAQGTEEGDPRPLLRLDTPVAGKPQRPAATRPSQS